MSRTFYNKNDFDVYLIIAQGTSAVYEMSFFDMVTIPANGSLNTDDVTNTEYKNGTYTGLICMIEDNIDFTNHNKVLCMLTTNTEPTTYTPRLDTYNGLKVTYNGKNYLTSNITYGVGNTTSVYIKYVETEYNDIAENLTINHGTLNKENFFFIYDIPYTSGAVIKYTISITPDTNYYIADRTIRLSFVTKGSSSTTNTQQSYFTTATSGNKSSLSVNLTQSYYRSVSINITGSLSTDVSNVFTLDITNHITNCTASVTPETIINGESFTIILTTNSGYNFTSDNIPYLTIGGVSVANFTIADDGLTASLTYTNLDTDYSSGIIYATAIETTSEVKYFTLDTTDYISNCTASVTPENITRGGSFTAVLTVNNGYKFTSDNTPYLNIGGFKVADFTVADNGLTASLTYTTSETDVSGYILANPDLIESVTGDYDFINVLHITRANLRALSKVRFNSSDTGIIDYGNYIVSLKKFYCNIPASNVSMNIALGTLNTGVSAEVIASSKITLDCGNIAIESTNNNENDYNNNIKIIIPFVGNVTLDASAIMNRKINLSYEISIITGDLVATVKDVNTNIILAQFNGNIAETIPYTLNNIASEVRGGFNTQSGLLYGFIPKIIIMYHDNYNDNTYYNDDKRGVLSAVASGLCEIDNVVINDLSSINNDEYDLIINELARGVIFD